MTNFRRRHGSNRKCVSEAAVLLLSIHMLPLTHCRCRDIRRLLPLPKMEDLRASSLTHTGEHNFWNWFLSLWLRFYLADFMKHTRPWRPVDRVNLRFSASSVAIFDAEAMGSQCLEHARNMQCRQPSFYTGRVDFTFTRPETSFKLALNFRAF